MATRLNKVLSSLIHPDQVGFFKHRNLKDSTRRLCDIIDYLQISKIPAILYFSDAEKASDWVHWGFLKMALLKMGIRECFMQWIELIYAFQTAEIWREGQKSKKSVTTRGVQPVPTIV